METGNSEFCAEHLSEPTDGKGSTNRLIKENEELLVLINVIADPKKNHKKNLCLKLLISEEYQQFKSQLTKNSHNSWAV